MKFHVYAINWNEENILRSFFKHYYQAEHIYILDNNSSDRSVEIAQSYSATIIPFDTNNTLDDSMHAVLKNTIWKRSRGIVDYVIVQDLDEFLFFPKFPNNIMAGLINLKENGITISKSQGYNMYCTDEEYDTFTKYEQSITSFITNGCIYPHHTLYDKCLVFDPNKIDETNFTVGSHSCSPTGEVKFDTTRTLLLHYKYMGKNNQINRYKVVRDRIGVKNRERNYGAQYYKTDNEIQSYISDLYDKYSQFNIFSTMYEDRSIIQATYRKNKYVLHTFGKSDYIGNTMSLGNVWEPFVAEKIYSLCSIPKTCYIDIGANVGTHVSIAKCANVDMIYAFECNPPTASKLNSTVMLNGWKNIKVFDKALSDTETILPFTHVKDNIGASYIPINRKGWNGNLENVQGGIQTCTYDSLNINIESYDNIVVKLDIEGHELQALYGMRGLLENTNLRSMIIELNPACVWLPSILSIIDYLEQYGIYPDELLFIVPGNDWSGKETDGTRYNKINKDQIIEYIQQGKILEVLFTRKVTSTVTPA